MNYDWIKQEIITLCINIIDKYEYMKFPLRAVMIRADYCYCCDKLVKESYQLREDSFNGRYNHISWIYCTKCKLYVNLADKYVYNEANYIRYEKCEILQNRNFSFWRVSSNKLIKPYIQKEAIIDKKYGDMIFQYDNRVATIVTWNDDLSKSISLSNLIFYNRDFFGYELDEFPIYGYPKKWISLFEKEYKIANEWYYLILSLNKIKYIPNDIKKNIFYYWNSLHLF